MTPSTQLPNPRPAHADGLIRGIRVPPTPTTGSVDPRPVTRVSRVIRVNDRDQQRGPAAFLGKASCAPGSLLRLREGGLGARHIPFS
jgi:hypothetical protein